MIAVIQRISGAKLTANEVFRGEIGAGLYLLLGVTKEDTEADAVKLAEKISKLRIFSDDNGKMNLSVNDISGEVMVVSNFTLCAKYSHGNRPEYFSAALPESAIPLYEAFVREISLRVRRVVTGVFGADMTVEIIGDGPVTIVMDSKVLIK